MKVKNSALKGRKKKKLERILVRTLQLQVTGTQCTQLKPKSSGEDIGGPQGKLCRSQDSTKTL